MVGGKKNVSPTGDVSVMMKFVEFVRKKFLQHQSDSNVTHLKGQYKHFITY
jgi:hypothetical protein